MGPREQNSSCKRGRGARGVGRVTSAGTGGGPDDYTRGGLGEGTREGASGEDGAADVKDRTQASTPGDRPGQCVEAKMWSDSSLTGSLFHKKNHPKAEAWEAVLPRPHPGKCRPRLGTSSHEQAPAQDARRDRLDQTPPEAFASSAHNLVVVCRTDRRRRSGFSWGGTLGKEGGEEFRPASSFALVPT